MGDIRESELFVKFSEFFGKYKKFCFDAMAKVPYGRVPAWIAFSDGRMEDAFKERRSVGGSLKDFYAITALGILLSLVAFWMMLAFVGLFVGVAAMLAVVGFLANPVMTAAAVIGALLLIVVGPGLYMLFRAAVFHIVAKFFGGSGSYADTLSLLVMTSAGMLVLMIPMYLLYAIIIGWFLSPISYAIVFYALYLQYRGAQLVHSMPSGRALATVVTAFLAEVGIFVGLYLAFYLGLMALSLSLKGA